MSDLDLNCLHLPRRHIFSHLCLYEIGFLRMWETSISYDHEADPLVLGTIHSKVWEKESAMSQPIQDREISPRGRNFNQGCKPRPWLKFLPRVRFPYPAWTLMMDSYVLMWRLIYSTLSASTTILIRFHIVPERCLNCFNLNIIHILMHYALAMALIMELRSKSEVEMHLTEKKSIEMLWIILLLYDWKMQTLSISARKQLQNEDLIFVI